MSLRKPEKKTNANRQRANEAAPDSMTSSALQTVFLTTWIYIIVEKSISGHWGLLDIPYFPTEFASYLNFRVMVYLLIWYMFQCLLYLLPIGGSLVNGLPTNDTGKRLKYRLNALFVLVVNLAVFLLAWMCGLHVTAVYDQLLQYTTAGVITIIVTSVILLISGKNRSKSGNKLNDWFNGTILNPRIGPLDFKYVSFRSAIIGWVLMNFINLIKSFESGSKPSTALLALVAFQLLYVVDYFWFEDGVLVTRDIVHENLGYNRLVQFLMIPFVFAVHTRYILLTNYALSWYCLIAVIALNLLGYWIYRGSNSEKNDYRRNPNDSAFDGYEVIKTSSGKNLLVSGWWALSRHPNYFGDIIIAFSYGLFTGFNHVLPYFNTLFLVMMLVDRERQDGEECSKRYGEAWETYCHRVKYRIIPYVY